MKSTLDNSSLSLNQDTNQFLVQAEIEPQISYIIMRNFSHVIFLISHVTYLNNIHK